MGFLDKAMTGGGIVLAGLLARTVYLDARETSRRKASPLMFDEGITEDEFATMAERVASRTPRVIDVRTVGMTSSLRVRSNSGLTTWRAEVDFNDYGHLTGNYWVSSENKDSPIPEHFATKLREEIGAFARQPR